MTKLQSLKSQNKEDRFLGLCDHAGLFERSLTRDLGSFNDSTRNSSSHDVCLISRTLWQYVSGSRNF